MPPWVGMVGYTTPVCLPVYPVCR